MKEPMEDSDLRDAFASLRAHLRASEVAPPFDAMMARARADAESILGLPVHRRWRPLPSRRAVWIGGVLGTAMAAAVAGILLAPRDSADQAFVRLVEAYSTNPAEGAWRSPTRGLLTVSGLDLMKSVPAVGVVVQSDGLHDRS